MKEQQSKVLRFEQCPSCAAKGEDVSQDNLAVYDDGHSFCYKENLFFPSKDKESFFDLNAFTYEYIPIRGISRETLIKYNVRTKINGEGRPLAIGFPYPSGSTKVRYLDRKDFYWSNSELQKPCLFGSDRFNSGEHKYVIITEGEFDALSLYQATGAPTVSVQSSGSGVRDCAAERTFLNSFDRIYLALDNDAPGREAAAGIAKLFDFNKVYLVKFDRYKDANDYLQNNCSVDLQSIWLNARRYQPDSVKSTFQEFEDILNEEIPDSVPYPFNSLNEKTYGIRTGESVLITAQEGVGKTELMHAIEYKLLKETDDAIGAIFLEEPKRRHLQALAGLELGRPIHLPDQTATTAETVNALQNCVGTDERLHIYSHFGSDDPESILDIIRFLVTARNCKYILFDHITMAVSGLAGEDERRALDYLSTRLEMMVKELNFALILVSHVNDDGRTRGSRYISKIADIRIDLSRDISNPDPKVRNTTIAVVSKNRFSGKTGPAAKLLFDPVTYTYSEINDDEVWQPPANDNDIQTSVQEAA